ncbi:MAG: O-phosphoserine--tRNA ligase [bacterium]|nr:O-phosphoserine--tRNA ligase [bacterium]
MHLLFVHSDKFHYELEENTKTTEPIEDCRKFLNIGKCLVVYATVERLDAVNSDLVCKKAAYEIKDVYSTIGGRRIFLNPYAHFLSELAPPKVALEIMKKIENILKKDYEVYSCPFGWHKACNIHDKGHPVSVLSRIVNVEDGEKNKKKRGKENPVSALNVQLREIFLELGFDEIINPMIVDEREVYLQYGPEAPLILDRVYYLAGMDRADIGLSDNKIEKIKEIIPNFNRIKEMQWFLRKFKEGKIEGDDFVEEMVKELRISEQQALELIDKVFLELKELNPIPYKKTLRSHMTALWYSTLVSFQDRRILPLNLFSIGPRFRREQRQDSSHLYESTSASIVVMDEKFTLEDGKKITKEILVRLGFSNFEYVVKKVTSNYYTPETDTEVFAEFKGQKVEVANFGFYSNESLSNYGIKYPVFNLGLGVERLSLLLEGANDIRTLVYPQYVHTINLTDNEIASSLRPYQEPVTMQGIKLAENLINMCLENKDKIGPIEVLIYKGDFLNKKIKLWIYNWDQGKKLISHAYLNSIFVHEGSMYSLPSKDSLPKETKMKKRFDEVYEKGKDSGLCFISLIVKKFTHDLELALNNEKKNIDLKFKMIKRPSEVNLYVPTYVNNYITSKNKKILIGGPLFFGLKVDIE